MYNWFIAAPFISDASDTWLARFIKSDKFSFHSVPATYCHDRSRPVTGRNDWLDYYQHGAAVWRAAERSSQPAGIIACFPQLATTVGLQKRIRLASHPIVAWNFNLGVLTGGVRKLLARFALASIDRFVVHSQAEISVYSNWLNLPRDRFRFVPLQRAVKDIKFEEDLARPFVLSMGTARRDYGLLFDVLSDLRYEAIVVAGPHALAGLTVPENVKVLSGLSLDQCHKLVQRARVNIVPISNSTTASGQVTFLDAMMYGRPTVVTRCAASVDYIEDGVDGLLVPPGDHSAMRFALESLWTNTAQRARLGLAARQTVINNFSDIPISLVMADMLGEFN